MKKLFNYLLMPALLLFSVNSIAQTTTDTTFVFNQKKIKVHDKDEEIKVQVFKTDSTEQYKKIFEGIYTDQKSYEKWTVKETVGWDFDIFSRKSKSKNRNMESSWGGIGWGFATITDGKNWHNVNGVDVKVERSNEFFINPIEVIIPMISNVVGISSGVGFSWHNHFLEKNTHFVEENDLTTIESAPNGIVYYFSRLRTFQINIPVLLEIQPTNNNVRKLYLSAGVVGGINTFASQKVKYRDEKGKMIKEVDGKGLNTARLTMDFIGQIGYNDLGIYLKYSPFSMFQKGKGPNVQTASIGLKLNF